MRLRIASACLLVAASVPRSGASAQGGSLGGAITGDGAAVANVVVFLVPVPPSTAAAAVPMAVEMDQRSLQFVPHVLIVAPGSTVAFTNSDRVMHDVFHPPKGGSAFDLGLFGSGERRSYSFKGEGAYVVFCHVHPEMVGYVVVLDTPWRTVSDDGGRFEFVNVPAGTYVLHTWHGRFEEHRRQVVAADGEHLSVDVSLTRGAPGEPRAGPSSKQP